MVLVKRVARNKCLRYTFSILSGPAVITALGSHFVVDPSLIGVAGPTQKELTSPTATRPTLEIRES